MTTFFYIGVLVVVGYLSYLRIAATTWDERERRRIIRDQLHLGHLLQLMEARDVQQIADIPHQRNSLFRDFSSFLLEDVRQLRKGQPLRFPGWCWLGLFYCGYGLVLAKSRFGWGRNDLSFLAGLELGLIRSISRD